ncbi:MAG: DUF389 domain-containing protein [Desertimonas sp.]
MADLIHLQVVAPAGLREEVTAYVEDNEAALNVVVWTGAARQPHGDVLTFDVPREAINQILADFEEMGVVEHGSITVFHTELTLSHHAEQAHDDAPGDPVDTVIWDEVAVTLRAAAVPSMTYVAFYVVAAVIGAVGVLTDSPILIVGAMVVGPDYAPLASVAFGIHRRDRQLVKRGAVTFAIGAAVAIGTAALIALLIRVLGQTPEPYSLDQRPNTEFITNPDIFTVIVAAAAAVAGMMALTQQRAGTLVGVLISVTTVPAMAEIGVQIAFGHAQGIGGALTQLGLNLACIVTVGSATLAILQRASPDLTRPTAPLGIDRLP